MASVVRALTPGPGEGRADRYQRGGRRFVSVVDSRALARVRVSSDETPTAHGGAVLRSGHPAGRPLAGGSGPRSALCRLARVGCPDALLGTRPAGSGVGSPPAGGRNQTRSE